MTAVIPAELAHIPAVMDLERAAFDPPWSQSALVHELNRADTYFAVATQDGAVAGFVILRLVSGEAELFQIVVADTARRSGVGGALLAGALSFARRNDIETVYLEVRKNNAPAVRLYEKVGFKQAGLRKNYYVRPVEDAVIMTLDLHLADTTEGDV